MCSGALKLTEKENVVLGTSTGGTSLHLDRKISRLFYETIGRRLGRTTSGAVWGAVELFLLRETFSILSLAKLKRIKSRSQHSS